MTITCKRTDDGWVVTGTENGNVAATLTLQKVGIYLMLHNTINLWTPRTVRIYREVLKWIKEGAKATGIKFIITANVFKDDLPKKEKYWRMMGMDIFTEFEYNGVRLRAAGMEL
jgi:ribosomal protein L5